MDNSIEQKQQFLRAQILQSGIDPNDFMAFMGKIKNQGQEINLQNWTIAELKNIVKDFKLKIEGKEKQNQHNVQEILSKELVKSLLRNKVQKTQKKKVSYGRDGLWDYQSKNQQQCKKIVQRINIQKEPKIEYVIFETKKAGGFFFGIGARDELWITIKNNFGDQKVVRKNEDFEWLRYTFVAQNMGCYVPPLQHMSDFEPQDNGMKIKRIKVILNFMNNLFNYQYLAQSQLLWNFLKIENYEQFNKLKKRYQISHSKISSKLIQTTSGTITPQISERMLGFMKQSSEFTHESQNMAKILGDMQNLSKHILYIANDFARLHDLFTKLTEKSSLKDTQTSNIFIYLNNLFTAFNKNTKNHSEIVKQIMKEFIRPIQQQWVQFGNFQKKRTYLLNQYLNNKLLLQKRKEKIIDDPTKWETREKDVEKLKKQTKDMKKSEIFDIILPRDTEAQSQKKAWQAYLNTTYENSFNFLIMSQQTKYIKHLENYIKRVSKINLEENSCLQSFKEIVVI